MTTDRQIELTPRQKSVLRLLLSGYKTPEIGVSMGITPNAVKEHLRWAMNKTGMGNRIELAVFIHSRPELLKEVMAAPVVRNVHERRGLRRSVA